MGQETPLEQFMKGMTADPVHSDLGPSHITFASNSAPEKDVKCDAKCDGAVTLPDWLGAWRALAAMVYGIEREDRRFQPVMAALDKCDTAYLGGDWEAFRQAADHVRSLVHEQEGVNEVR